MVFSMPLSCLTGNAAAPSLVVATSVFPGQLLIHYMQYKDILAVLLVVAIWGSNFVVIRVGLDELPPLLFTALRFVFAAFPLVLLVPRPTADWTLIAGYGLFQFAFQFGLLFSGIQFGFSPGLASLVIQLQAFFTIGIAILLLNERPHRLQMVGAAAAFSGMCVVAAHLDGKPTIIGFVLIVLGAVCWSVANILTKKMGKINALSLVAWGSMIAWPPLLLASYLLEGRAAWSAAIERFSLTAAAAVLFQSYPNTILGFGIWSILMRKYAAAAVAPFTLLVPVTGMLTATLVLDEPLQWWKLAAGLLVLCGLALNQLGTRSQRSLAPAS